MIFWLKWNDRKGMKKGKQKQKTKTKKTKQKNTWGKSQRNNPLLSYYNYINFLIRIRLFITFITSNGEITNLLTSHHEKISQQRKKAQK